MINWYLDNDLQIEFSNVPNIKERYITPLTPKGEYPSIKKYPYKLCNELYVKISDYENMKCYEFIIPKGYCYDGASIPNFIWFLVGSPTDNRYIVGACVHDWLCEQHRCIEYNRKLSTRVLRSLFIKGGTNKVQAYIMCWFVDIWQKLFCKW